MPELDHQIVVVLLSYIVKFYTYIFIEENHMCHIIIYFEYKMIIKNVTKRVISLCLILFVVDFRCKTQVVFINNISMKCQLDFSVYMFRLVY